MNIKLKYVATSGIFLAIATLLSYIESLFPLPIPLPAVRLGLANSAVLILLYLFPPRYAAAVSFLKVILVFLLRGNATALLLSASGALVSFAVMLLLKNAKLFSPIGVSVGGAAAHVTAQVAVSCLLIGNFGVFYYLSYLLLISLVTGTLSGSVGLICIKRLGASKAVTHVEAIK